LLLIIKTLFIGLDEHLKANHEDLKNVSEARSKDFTLWPDQTPWCIPQKLVFRNRSFFTVFNDATEENDYAVFWIYFHGTPEEAVHYTYQIKIIGGNGTELSFKGKVHSLDLWCETVTANKDLFILYAGQAKRFQVDGKINFEITLF
jgi:hypothetical protein